MKAISPVLTQELEVEFVKGITRSEPFYIPTYRKLVEIVANLSYLNETQLLFYRGQKYDYKNKEMNSTFYPSIYRSDYLSQKEIEARFQTLEGTCKLLIQTLCKENIQGFKDIKRKKFIQWSILQHYEICPTPLLDLTHSLRVACSFALFDNNNDFGYIFVFGLPYLTNRISINSEDDIINIRLLSICPPQALRPYFQEGYLAGTSDITYKYDTKGELDFNQRLIAKFKIPRNGFWGSNFGVIPEDLLYPRNDKIEKICSGIKFEAERNLKPDQIGDFLQKWTVIEKQIRESSKKFDQPTQSFKKALVALRSRRKLSEDNYRQIDKLRRFRNTLVHYPDRIKDSEVQDSFEKLLRILNQVTIL